MMGWDQRTLNAPVSAVVVVTAVFRPGWGVEQQGHVVMETLLVTIHSGQSHVSPAFLNTSISDWVCVPLPVLLVAIETEGTKTFMLSPVQHIQHMLCDHSTNKIFEQATQREHKFLPKYTSASNIHLRGIPLWQILQENSIIALTDEKVHSYKYIYFSQ
jgi:hypothetical protein